MLLIFIAFLLKPIPKFLIQHAHDLKVVAILTHQNVIEEKDIKLLV